MMTATRFDRTITIGDFVGDGVRHPAPKPQRFCRCGTRLSMYNDSQDCFSCASQRPYVPPAAKVDQRLADRLATALEAARALEPVFTSGDLALALGGVQPNVAHSLLRKLVSQGTVRTMGRAVPTDRPLKGRDSRRAVLMWAVVGESRGGETK